MEQTAYNEVHEKLSAYRAPAELLSWRAGATSRDKKRAQALVYCEPRAYQEALDELAPGWEVSFQPWGENKLICTLTILGVTRASTGEYEQGARGAVAEGTVAEAQAFKRACVMHGLMRYLYEIPAPWVDYDDEKKRLVETPELPARFLPGRPVAGRAASQAPAEAPAPAGPLLSEARAKAMGAELEKLGFSPREQLRLAGTVVRRAVASLAELTEAQALEVWGKAKRDARRSA